MAGRVDNRNVQTNPVLTEIVQQYRPTGFVADIVAPRVKVAKELFQYWTYDDGVFHRTDVNLKKADKTEAKTLDLNFTPVEGRTEEYAAIVRISDRERENVDSQVRLEESKVNQAADALKLAREVRVAALLQETTAGSLANGSAPSNNWNVDGATIEADLQTAALDVWNRIGYSPDTVVIPYQVAHAVAVQADIREIIKYTVDGQKILSEGLGILPPQLYGLNVVIPKVKATTSATGTVNDATEVWGDDVRVLYTGAGNTSWGNPIVCQTFVSRDYEVRQWRDESIRCDVYEVSEVVAEVVTASGAGYELQNLLS